MESALQYLPNLSRIFPQNHILFPYRGPKSSVDLPSKQFACSFSSSPFLRPSFVSSFLHRHTCFSVKNCSHPPSHIPDSVALLLKRSLFVGAMICGAVLLRCKIVLAAESILEGNSIMSNVWPTAMKLLKLFKDQGIVLTALLGLSAFFSMAETSITTLWPWKVRELAEKEPDNGVFKMLRSDVTRFLTTILIGTTVVNIGATALVTDAATALFGEAGVSAATGVMTVAILLLTEITPKSIAVHNATEVARVVACGLALLRPLPSRKNRYLFINGNAEAPRSPRKKVISCSLYFSFSIFFLGVSEPYVTEDELKLMLRGAELSGAIEEEEQDMIENVLEIKDTHVREVMTPLVDVVAIDSSSSLLDFHALWVTHQYSRVPVFEQRVDNIVGIAYAMDLLDYAQKGEMLEATKVGGFAHKPAYFVPDSMLVWNLLREFRIRKVHMAVVLNEYGGTVGIVTLEDVVEEIVGEIFDENDSKEEIERKTGYIVMRAEGIYDVDANTSIDQLSEDLNIKMAGGHQYETVSGFVCEAFGYIPRTGEMLKVVVEKGVGNGEDDHSEGKSERQEIQEKYQIFKLEILAGNARKVSAVRFELINENIVIENDESARVFPRKWNSDQIKDNDFLGSDDEDFFERPGRKVVTEYDDR